MRENMERNLCVTLGWNENYTGIDITIIDGESGECAWIAAENCGYNLSKQMDCVAAEIRSWVSLMEDSLPMLEKVRTAFTGMAMSGKLVQYAKCASMDDMCAHLPEFAMMAENYLQIKKNEDEAVEAAIFDVLDGYYL